MKKYLAFLGAAALLVALASPSMAQPVTQASKFVTWGHIEVETYWTKNMLTFNDDAADNRRAVAERFRMFLGWGDPKTVRAIVGFEADSTAWGETGAPFATSTSYQSSGTAGITGQPSLAGRNHMGTYQTDQVALEIKWAYLDFTVPNTPLSLRAGIQNFAIGGSLGRFWLNNDAPGVRLIGNFAPHTVEAIWFKENKQNYFTDNDNDMYLVRYLLAQKMFNIEAFFAYQNDRRSRVETWSWNSSTGGFLPTSTVRNFERQPWWLGANVPVRFGNFTLDVTGIYLGGKAQKSTVSGGTDVDYSAWLADLMLTYRLGPGLSFTGEGFYSSGQDFTKTDEINRYAWADNSEARNVFGNGKSVFFFSNTELTYYGFKQLDAGGLWYARANAEFSPLAWLNFGVNYFYIGDTSKEGNAIFGAKGASGVAAKRDDSHKVGQEINLITTIKIYENFRYMIGAAYFFPGDIYKNELNQDDNAWNILTNLRYVF